MHELEPISRIPVADQPRHAHQEVVDLLAAGLLRLRARRDSSPTRTRDEVDLGFVGQERVNANPDNTNGVRP